MASCARICYKLSSCALAGNLSAFSYGSLHSGTFSNGYRDTSCTRTTVWCGYESHECSVACYRNIQSVACACVLDLAVVVTGIARDPGVKEGCTGPVFCTAHIYVDRRGQIIFAEGGQGRPEGVGVPA